MTLPIKNALLFGNVRPIIVSNLEGYCSQLFGENLSPVYSQWGLKGHNGIDIPCLDGEPVYATRDGVIHKVVEDTAPNGTRGLGIVRRDKNLVEGKYFVDIHWHLKEFLVQEGQEVKEGDVIAKADSTGYSSGTHLHYGIKFYDAVFNTLNADNGYGGYVDPIPYLKGHMLPTPVLKPAPIEPEQYLILDNGIELRLENQDTLHTLIAGGQLPGMADQAYVVKKGVLIIVPES